VAIKFIVDVTLNFFLLFLLM